MHLSSYKACLSLSFYAKSVYLIMHMNTIICLFIVNVVYYILLIKDDLLA